MKEENTSQQKNISLLNDNIKFLSQKSLMMAKSLMILENESNDIKTKMAES